MSELFGRDKSVVSRHIKNILFEEELDNSVVAKFALKSNFFTKKRILAFFALVLIV